MSARIFFERISEPKSQLHSDYLSYRSGAITKNELVGRLPHVAMLGDSVCMDIYISSPWSTFWRAHLQLRYSDALARADLSRAELLHSIDGWHASVEGHSVLAEAAFSDLGPSLEFLGIA